MTEGKYTPGPWRWEDDSTRMSRDLHGRYRITAKARRAETMEATGKATSLIALLPALSEHNGPLIAAAPELLEIAEKALEDAEWERYNTSALRAIIAKAKGEISE